MSNFATVLDHNLARYPDKTVLSQGERRVTNRELHARVSALAAGLHELGVGRGDVVALLLYNHIEFIETVLAVNRIGAAFLPLNFRLSPHEWRFILEHSQAVAVVTEAEFTADLAAATGDLPSLKHRLLLGEGESYDELLAAHRGVATPAVPLKSDALQRLMYTSGTTSRPKGVKISHGNLIWKNLAHIVEFGITADDVTLVCGPLYHVGGLDLPGLGVLYAGGGLILTRKFDAAEVADTIERERPSNIWLAPSMMNAILQLPGIGDRDLSSIRFIIGGGEKMPVPLIQRILAAFPKAWFADAYGLTETVSGDTFNDAEHMLTKVGSVGRPVVHLEVRIVDDSGEPVGTGEPGEITLRGPKVFSGYWRDEDATAEALRNGWFHTGDIGRVDEDGYLYVEDRKKDMIVSGGENIATPEVERVLYEHPDIVEAAVIGVPHPRWGEVPKAFVVLREGVELDTASLTAFCRDRLAKFKVPAELEFLQVLPRTPSGKVLKRVLREGGLA